MLSLIHIFNNLGCFHLSSKTIRRKKHAPSVSPIYQKLKWGAWKFFFWLSGLWTRRTCLRFSLLCTYEPNQFVWLLLYAVPRCIKELRRLPEYRSFNSAFQHPRSPAHCWQSRYRLWTVKQYGSGNQSVWGFCGRSSVKSDLPLLPEGWLRFYRFSWSWISRKIESMIKIATAIAPAICKVSTR